MAERAAGGEPPVVQWVTLAVGSDWRLRGVTVHRGTPDGPAQPYTLVPVDVARLPRDGAGALVLPRAPDGAGMPPDQIMVYTHADTGSLMGVRRGDGAGVDYTLRIQRSGARARIGTASEQSTDEARPDMMDVSQDEDAAEADDEERPDPWMRAVMTCAYCDKREWPGAAAPRMQCCSRCRARVYCDMMCAAADWPAHRHECPTLADDTGT